MDVNLVKTVMECCDTAAMFFTCRVSGIHFEKCSQVFLSSYESHKVKAEASNVARPKQLENMRLKRETSKRMESMKKGRPATMTRRPVNVGKTFHRLMPGVQVFTRSK